MTRTAVLIVDLCGFSKHMKRRGRPAAKARVYRMRALGRAIIEAQGGTLVNAFADNLFAVLPDVHAAVKAATEIQAIAEVSAGIGVGDIEIDGPDIWANEMNAASKLGEDLAGRGQILLTPAAQRAFNQCRQSSRVGE